MPAPRSAGRVSAAWGVPFRSIPRPIGSSGGARIVASIANDSNLVSWCFQPSQPLRIITSRLPVIANIPSRERV